MRNVQCAGRDFWSPVHGQLSGTPCGWKGERLGWISQPQREGETIEAMIERVATYKPCPRCGGRVQLIEVAS